MEYLIAKAILALEWAFFLGCAFCLFVAVFIAVFFIQGPRAAVEFAAFFIKDTWYDIRNRFKDAP